jgi:hypothetical protein
MGENIVNNALRQNPVFQNTPSNTIGQENILKTSAFNNNRVIPFTLISGWKEVVESRLNELAALPLGWDGYTGLPVSFDCAYFAANMLERLFNEGVPAPSIVPGSDGSLQIEWHRKMFDVELDVLKPQYVVATRLNLNTDKEETIEIQNDFSKIVPWITELSDNL